MGCSEDPTSYEIVVGKPYYLEIWPDSAFIANLDSIADAEPVKGNGEAVPELSVSPMLAPLQRGPGSPKASTGSAVVSNQSATVVPPRSEEDFAERFQKAMERLQAEPGNAKLYREETLRDGEDLLGVLRRAYGKDAYRLPAFVVKSQLESLNGISAQDLKPGQTVKIPKL